MRRIGLGLLVSAGISLAGYLARALSGRGAVAAVGVGTSVATGTRGRGIAALGTFFVSSSALSRLARRSGAHQIAAKGSRRDARQVLANGGVAAMASVAAFGNRRDLARAACLGSLAAANADTWATEIGASAAGNPRLLLSRRVVERGTSGAVSRRGTISAAAGASLIGLVGAVGRRGDGFRIGGIVAMAGVLGSLIDSILGETVQERRYCPVCERPTEARVHRCGTPTILTGGVPGIDNDAVNLACTMAGGLTAWAGYAWLSRWRGTPGRSRR